AGAPAFALVRQLQGVPNAGASFANPFGPDLTFPTFPAYSPTTQRTISFIDQAYRPPVTQQFSLNLQTELGRNLMLEVGYVGTRGTHQILTARSTRRCWPAPRIPFGEKRPTRLPLLRSGCRSRNLRSRE